MSVRAVLRLCVLCCLGACGGSAPPSLLVVTIDTLRADVLAPWGAPAPDPAPALTGLCRLGTRFASCSTVTPLTLPAHASLFTGLRPSQHGLTVNGVARPQLPVSTLAEELRSEGYATAAFVSTQVLDRCHGLDAGFDLYDDDLQLPEGPPRPTERDGELTTRHALDWLARQQGPWFAWVHLYDPHSPYAAPGGRREPPRAAYLDEVSHADRQLARLLRALSSERETLVLVVSDHGEGLGDHGEATHGVLLYESTVHVPLVLARLGAVREQEFPRPGEVRTEPVSLLDLRPTLEDLLGLQSAPGTAAGGGRSLRKPVPDRALPLESRATWFYYGFSPLAGVRKGSLKLLAAPRADPPGLTLFDLSTDPGELAGQTLSRHALLADLPDTEPLTEASPTGERQALLSLGYLGSAPRATDRGPLRDPRTALALIDGIDAANTALVQGQPALALQGLQQLEESFYDVPELQLFLGKARRALGQPQAAADALQRAAALQPASLGILLEWGKALMERDEQQGGDGAEARGVLEQALRSVPGDPEAVALRSLHDVMFGDPREALSRLDAALRDRPRAANLLLVKARALDRLGRAREAAAVRGQLPGAR